MNFDFNAKLHSVRKSGSRAKSEKNSEVFQCVLENQFVEKIEKRVRRILVRDWTQSAETWRRHKLLWKLEVKALSKDTFVESSEGHETPSSGE